MIDSFWYWDHWGTAIGLCFAMCLSIFIPVTWMAWSKARTEHPKILWPVHGRYVTFLFLFCITLNLVDFVRIRWLAPNTTQELLHSATNPIVFFARASWALAALWFGLRWREGTLLSYPKGRGQRR